MTASFLAAAAAELLAEFHVMGRDSDLCGVRLNLLARPHLTGPHILALVKLGDWDAPRRSPRLLADYRYAAPFGRAVHPSISIAVGFVENQDVEVAGAGVYELVEVLDHGVHSRVAMARNFAQDVRERAGALGVQHGSTLPGQLTEQRQAARLFRCRAHP
ncbi:hypothetical protein [Williamsia serinedens]|uniref:hypothetical protein n=1 Tax=Williamsia serinedens TaxID=391736 RepID=UPI0027E3528A|nr:hypothetical protein [Williamsia serinedens]